jgi:hypothetical protein
VLATRASTVSCPLPATHAQQLRGPRPLPNPFVEALREFFVSTIIFVSAIVFVSTRVSVAVSE